MSPSLTFALIGANDFPSKRQVQPQEEFSLQGPGADLLESVDLHKALVSSFHQMLTASVARPGLLPALIDAVLASTASHLLQWDFLLTAAPLSSLSFSQIA